MGRNNADFQGMQVLYHVTDSPRRSSIEKHGLRAYQPWEETPHGVYVGKYPHALYGDDIWEIKIPKDEELKEDPIEYGGWVIPRSVGPHEIRRVGHTVENPRTHYTEVHWHPAEECTGRAD